MKATPIVILLFILLTLTQSGCEYLAEAETLFASNGQTHAEDHHDDDDDDDGEDHDDDDDDDEDEDEDDDHGHKEAHSKSHGDSGHHAVHKIVVTSPVRKNVISTQQYVCQIRSCKHIEVCALEGGYLEKIGVREGQTVRTGDLMFKIQPTLYQAKLDSEAAEAERVQIELSNAESLAQKGIVSPQELAIKRAELAKAQANANLAQAELAFTEIKAPFDGIINRLEEQLGSLVEEGDVLTTLSDNSVMWVYFNVPESRYLEYMEGLEHQQSLDIELQLAHGKKFSQTGKIGAIEADFNNETGNIAFRADFPNPNSLLRHGQTGTILIHRTLNDVVVIPQRATFEILAKRYAFVLDEKNVIHQREIVIESEMDDIFVIREGLEAGEKIVLEGIRQVRDGDQVKYEFRDPTEVLANLKYHAE